jgi:hypothetical protein
MPACAGMTVTPERPCHHSRLALRREESLTIKLFQSLKLWKSYYGMTILNAQPKIVNALNRIPTAQECDARKA